jgi:hypothetical protein
LVPCLRPLLFWGVRLFWHFRLLMTLRSNYKERLRGG